jgi:hypothetical protein
MVLVSLAAAVLALQTATANPAKPDPNTGVSNVFATYCGEKHKDGKVLPQPQPYCGENVPPNVKWLVLYSLCTADRQRDPFKTAYANDYKTLCEDFEKEVVNAESNHERKFLTYSPRLDQWSGLVFNTKKKDKPTGAAGTAGTAAAKDTRVCAQGTLDASGWYCKIAASDWLDIDETGLATVTRGASDDIPVVITGTNVLLYRTTPETVTSEDIAALASLQQLALGLGGTLQAAIGVYEQSRLDQQRAHQLSFLATGGAPKSTLPSAVANVLIAYDQTIGDMADATRRLADATGAIGISRSQALGAIQGIEQALARPGDALTLGISQAGHDDRLSYGDVDKAYNDLYAEYQKTRDFGLGCRPLLRDFLMIAQHTDAAPDVLKKRLNEYLTKHAKHPGCVGVFDALAVEIETLAKRLVEAPLKKPDNPADMTGTFEDLIAQTAENYNTSLSVIVNPPPKAPDAADKDPRPLDAALALLTTTRDAALAVYNGVATAAAARHNYTFADTMLLTWLYAASKSDQLPWDKLQTHTFSLKPSAPLASGVTATHDETELKYKLQSSRTAGIGVGVGTFFTKLSTPTFDAVTDPTNKDQKVVSQTDSTTLAGQVALFADWRVISSFYSPAEKWFFRPSVQIGTNVSSTPGFFFGGSFDIFKYFRFGIGRTWQQSKMLNDQVADKTVIASKDDIKTRDVFVHGTYYSFTFALDSLPIFKKSDSGAGSTTKKAADDAAGTDTAAVAGDTTAAGTKTKKKGGS